MDRKRLRLGNVPVCCAGAALCARWRNLTPLRKNGYKDSIEFNHWQEHSSWEGGSRKMMPSRKILEYVFARPFRPFRIKMASGQTFEVPHPEMILVGRSTVRVFEPGEPDSEKADQWHDLSYLLMENLEPIKSSVA